MQEILRKNDNYAQGARIIIFDVNGEYKQAFNEKLDENIVVKFYKPNIEEDNKEYKAFYMPHFLMNLDEWSAFY